MEIILFSERFFFDKNYLIIAKVWVIKSFQGASLANGDGLGLILEPDVQRILQKREWSLLAFLQEDGLLPVLNWAVGVVVEDAGHVVGEWDATLVDVDGGSAGAIHSLSFGFQFLNWNIWNTFVYFVLFFKRFIVPSPMRMWYNKIIERTYQIK